MRPSIPDKRNFVIDTIYTDLNVARAILTANLLRGLCMLTVTDSLDPLRPRNWQILISGGTAFVGKESQYFILDNGRTNVTSVTAITNGYTYDLVDAFGNTYRLSFNGARDFTCTIQRTAGAALTGDITLSVLLFPFTDAN